MELLELEFQAIKEVKEEVAEVKEDLASFKEELPILALDIEKITKAKNKVAVNLLGGKDSKAYKNNSIRGKVYTDIARELKRQFGLETYKALKRNEVVKAIEVISNYKLPLCLKEEIKKVNKGQATTLFLLTFHVLQNFFHKNIKKVLTRIKKYVII